MTNWWNRNQKKTFNGVHKSYDKYETYTFEHIEILMFKQKYLAFVLLELSKLLMYETHYDKLQPYFGKEIYNYTTVGRIASC